MAAPQPHNQAQRNDDRDNEFDQRVLTIDRVARVVKGGRRFRFRALVAIGDGKGKIGVGSAKGADVTTAITKAADVAKKSMMSVHIGGKGKTVPHDTVGKVGGSHILIMPASEGTGLIAGSVTRDILEAAGIQNIVTKSLGNNNKTNVAYSVIQALEKLVPQKDWVTTKNAPKKAAKEAEKVEAK